MADKKKILIIDDEPDFVKILSIRLEHAGYEVNSSNNGFKGLEMVSIFKPDIVLLDVMMPEMNGFQCCRKIKEINRDIPVLMLTAKSMESDKYWGLESGADDYVTKPFETNDLLTKISKYLNTKISSEK